MYNEGQEETKHKATCCGNAANICSCKIMRLIRLCINLTRRRRVVASVLAKMCERRHRIGESPQTDHWRSASDSRVVSNIHVLRNMEVSGGFRMILAVQMRTRRKVSPRSQSPEKTWREDESNGVANRNWSYPIVSLYTAHAPAVLFSAALFPADVRRINHIFLLISGVAEYEANDNSPIAADLPACVGISCVADRFPKSLYIGGGA